MHQLSRLFIYYEEVRDNIGQDIGTIFNYIEQDNNGLKILAELMARGKRKGLASIYVHKNVVSCLCHVPTTDFLQGVNLGVKIEKIYEPGDFLLCMQVVPGTTFGDFIIVKTKEDGAHIQVYSVCGPEVQARHITDVYIDYEGSNEDVIEDVKRLNALISEESVCMIK